MSSTFSKPICEWKFRNKLKKTGQFPKQRFQRGHNTKVLLECWCTCSQRLCSNVRLQREWVGEGMMQASVQILHQVPSWSLYQMETFSHSNPGNAFRFDFISQHSSKFAFWKLHSSCLCVLSIRGWEICRIICLKPHLEIVLFWNAGELQCLILSSCRLKIFSPPTL